MIGVVLSGTLDDGAAGAAVIERCGGLVAVQDPAESAYEGMPKAALAVTSHPRVLSVPGIASLIMQQCQQEAVRADDPLDPGPARRLA